MGTFERRVLDAGFLFKKYWSRCENSEKYDMFFFIIRWYHFSNPQWNINYRLLPRCPLNSYMWTSRSNITQISVPMLVFSLSLWCGRTCWYCRFKCVLTRFKENFPGMNLSAGDFAQVIPHSVGLPVPGRSVVWWSPYRHFYFLSSKKFFIAL